MCKNQIKLNVQKPVSSRQLLQRVAVFLHQTMTALLLSFAVDYGSCLLYLGQCTVAHGCYGSARTPTRHCVRHVSIKTRTCSTNMTRSEFTRVTYTAWYITVHLRCSQQYLVPIIWITQR